ncbi:MAG TPA: Xaa-Pro dipeptidase [Eubacteriaceae bacterium]|nr:Xaa-Pro dipeptidase [Eubacteriaceae bacterium]
MSTAIASKRKKIYDHLDENTLFILFSGKSPHLSADSYYHYEPNRNFFYLTGISQENTIFVAIKSQKKTEEYLFIEKNDPVVAKWTGKKLDKEEATKLSTIDQIFYVEDFERKLHDLIKNYSGEIKHLALDLFKHKHIDDNTLAHKFISFARENYPQFNLLDASKMIFQQRSIKSKAEVQEIKKAIRYTKDAYELLLKNASSCKSENEMEAFIDFSFKQNNVRKAFDTICASGKNATVLHYVDNNGPLKPDQLILFDFGARKNYYCADISRTFPVGGTFSPRQREIYEIVLHTLKSTVQIMKPGISMKFVNEHAKKQLIEGAKKIGLIEKDEDIANYYYHSIGHPLGLDTHDPSGREVVLQPGMVFTCEPGLYVEEEEIGVRIEDDILITLDGNVNLSKDLIKEIDDIEAFMAPYTKQWKRGEEE